MAGGGPARAIDRSKRYDGYWCVQLAIDADLLITNDGHQDRWQGHVLWIGYPGPEIRFRSAAPIRPWYHRYVAVSGERPARWWQEGLLTARPQVLGDAIEWFAGVFDQIIADVRRGDPLGHRAASAALELLLVRAAEQRVAAEAEDAPWLDTARALLDDDRVFAPSIPGVAEACGMALSTFRRRFQAATGLSPQHWVIQRRLQLAGALLRDPEMSIATVAERLGYPSPFQFSRQFRRWTGVAPSVWRQAGERGDEVVPDRFQD